jgi:hypothetical protein
MQAMTTHGHCNGRTQTPEYCSWRAMIQNTSNPSSARWFYYSQFGITVCPEWRTSFQRFLADMGPRPPGARLRRIDRTGDFEPANCMWR